MIINQKSQSCCLPVSSSFFFCKDHVTLLTSVMWSKASASVAAHYINQQIPTIHAEVVTLGGPDYLAMGSSEIKLLNALTVRFTYSLFLTHSKVLTHAFVKIEKDLVLANQLDIWAMTHYQLGNNQILITMRNDRMFE